MFSFPDVALVSVIALLLFGPDKLPSFMRQAGRIMREVQNTSQSFISEMERAADLNETPVPVENDTFIEHEPIEHESIEHESIEHESIEHEPIEHEPIAHVGEGAEGGGAEVSPRYSDSGEAR